MISKPPALLVSWPQLLRADQKGAGHGPASDPGDRWYGRGGVSIGGKLNARAVSHARPVGTAVAILSDEAARSPFGESFGFEPLFSRQGRLL